MTGAELRQELLDLRLSNNEMARLTGIGGRTMTNYVRIDEPGHLPLWMNVVIRYAKLDPWFGRRLRNAGDGSYVPLRGSDQDRYEEILIRVERLAAALVEEDPGLAFRRTIALIWSCTRMAKHLRRVKEKYGARNPEPQDDAA